MTKGKIFLGIVCMEKKKKSLQIGLPFLADGRKQAAIICEGFWRLGSLNAFCVKTRKQCIYSLVHIEHCANSVKCFENVKFVMTNAFEQWKKGKRKSWMRSDSSDWLILCIKWLLWKAWASIDPNLCTFTIMRFTIFRLQTRIACLDCRIYSVPSENMTLIPVLLFLLCSEGIWVWDQKTKMRW